MKIIFLTKEMPYPINNGHRMRSYYYLQGLLRHNDVEMICLDGSDFYEARHHFEELGIKVFFTTNLKKLTGIIKIFKGISSLVSSLPYSVFIRFSKKQKKEINDILNQRNYDILVCDGIHLASYVTEDIKKTKVLNEHNIESVIISRYFNYEKNPLKKVLAAIECVKFRNFENKVWKIFNAIHVCSKVDRLIIRNRIQHGGVKVVSNGIDLSKFENLSVKASYNLIYTGLMGWKPNEDAVLYFIKDIYPLIKKEIPDANFTIVGKDPPRKIRKASKKDTSINVTGYVDDAFSYLAASEIFVAPIRIGSGTRLKILESFAMRKPVVSTTVGCEGLEVKRDENIFIEDRPDKFAQKVVSLLKNQELRERIGQAGRDLAEKIYSQEKICDDLDVFIKDLKLW